MSRNTQSLKFLRQNMKDENMSVIHWRFKACKTYLRSASYISINISNALAKFTNQLRSHTRGGDFARNSRLVSRDR